jgi:anti-anti-sigma factor
VRRLGSISSPTGLGLSDHVCWAYDSDEDLAAAAVPYLDEGRRLGQKLMYVADRPIPVLLDHLRDLGDPRSLLASGALVVHESDEIYEVGRPIDAERQLSVYSDAVDAAVAEGYMGVRVVADITPLVSEPEFRSAHAEWEHRADRWMAGGNPLSAMCTYDARVVPDETIEEIACVHPLTHADRDVGFHLYASAEGMALDGEIDGFTAPVLDNALRHARASNGAILDVSGVEFMDQHAALAIARHADELSRQGRQLLVTGGSQTMRQMWELLGLGGHGVRFA